MKLDQRRGRKEGEGGDDITKGEERMEKKGGQGRERKGGEEERKKGEERKVRKGEVVTVGYEGVSRRGVVMGARLVAIRPDREWDDVLRDHARDSLLGTSFSLFLLFFLLNSFLPSFLFFLSFLIVYYFLLLLILSFVFFMTPLFSFLYFFLFCVNAFV